MLAGPFCTLEDHGQVKMHGRQVPQSHSRSRLRGDGMALLMEDRVPSPRRCFHFGSIVATDSQKRILPER